MIRVEPEDRSDPTAAGDPVRARPHDLHRWLHTNKRSVRTGVDALLADADLIIHDGNMPLDGMPHSPVVCSITPFGTVGPYAGFVAEEINVIHGSSWGYLSPGGATDPEFPPLKAFGHHATINVATAAAAAALAAVTRRRRTGSRSDGNRWSI